MLRSAWRGLRDAPTSRFKTFCCTTARKSEKRSCIARADPAARSSAFTLLLEAGGSRPQLQNPRDKCALNWPQCPKNLRARLPPRQHDNVPARDCKRLRQLQRGMRHGPGLNTFARVDNTAFSGSLQQDSNAFVVARRLRLLFCRHVCLLSASQSWPKRVW